MTWNEMFAAALVRLYAHERTALPILERMAEKAHGDAAQGIVDEMIAAAPSRLGRLEVVCDLAGVAVDHEISNSVEGWSQDVDELVLTEPTGPVTDALILALVLKLTQTRSAAYEVAYVLGRRIGTEEIVNLIHTLWTEDQVENLNTSHVLLDVVTKGTIDWDSIFRVR